MCVYLCDCLCLCLTDASQYQSWGKNLLRFSNFWRYIRLWSTTYQSKGSIGVHFLFTSSPISIALLFSHHHTHVRQLIRTMWSLASLIRHIIVLLLHIVFVFSSLLVGPTTIGFRVFLLRCGALIGRRACCLLGALPWLLCLMLVCLLLLRLWVILTSQLLRWIVCSLGQTIGGFRVTLVLDLAGGGSFGRWGQRLLLHWARWHGVLSGSACSSARLMQL